MMETSCTGVAPESMRLLSSPPFRSSSSGPTDPVPGQSSVRHPAGTSKISRLVLDEDPGRLTGWLGDHQLPIVVREGRPAVAAIYISSDVAEIVFGSVDT